MTDGKESFERRRHMRFQVPTYGAYAVLRRPWPRSSITGDIVDISLGGLSFRYLGSKKCPYTSYDMDISLTDGGFCLNKLRVNTISDIEVESQTHLGLETRRCGVQFEDLRDSQKAGLRYFIQTYSTADPEA
jgi:c-di-GMP-binding flagellar brake protein YcgR